MACSWDFNEIQCDFSRIFMGFQRDKTLGATPMGFQWASGKLQMFWDALVKRPSLQRGFSVETKAQFDDDPDDSRVFHMMFSNVRTT